jgi:hypothetical protein
VGPGKPALFLAPPSLDAPVVESELDFAHSVPFGLGGLGTPDGKPAGAPCFEQKPERAPEREKEQEYADEVDEVQNAGVCSFRISSFFGDRRCTS